MDKKDEREQITFEAVYQNFYPNIEKIANSVMFKSKMFYEKEDVEQEMAITLFKALKSYHSEEVPIEHWIEKVLSNKSKNLLSTCWAEKRGLHQNVVSLDDESNHEKIVDENFFYQQEADIIAKQDVSKIIQNVLNNPQYGKDTKCILPYLFGFNKIEISRNTGFAQSSISRKINSFRKDMEEALQKEGYFVKYAPKKKDSTDE